MNRRLSTALKYLFSVLLTVVFLYVTFRGTDVHALVESVKDANYWWILLMFACLMLSHAVRAWRWRYLLEPIKPDIGFRNLFSGVMIGYLMNNILPRAGELARPYAIGKLEAIPKSAALGTIVVERLIDTVSFLVLVVLIPFVYHGPLVESFPWLQRSGMILSLVTLFALVVMVSLMLRRDWTDAVLRTLAPLLTAGIARRVDRMTHSFLDGFLFVKEPKNFLVIFLLSVAVWGLYVLMTYVAFFSFDLQHVLDLRAAIVILAISSIGVSLPTPGATGTYHLFATRAMTQLFLVPNETALSYATVTHAVGFVGVTIIGLYYLLQDHMKVSDAVRKGVKEGG
jgi:glycosyltransferase 2 family protein